MSAIAKLLAQHRFSGFGRGNTALCTCGVQCPVVPRQEFEATASLEAHVSELIEKGITDAKADAYDKAIQSCRIVHKVNPYRPDESDW